MLVGGITTVYLLPLYSQGPAGPTGPGPAGPGPTGPGPTVPAGSGGHAYYITLHIGIGSNETL